MTTPYAKGSSLELAVHAIESAILRSSPAYNDKTFSIQMKRLVTVSGVRHEIDIWVTADLGSGYEAIFIFECKNWQEKVSKNELIIFSEKIRATLAQIGFFVAKSFTADAEAQAALDPRIRLLRVADLPAADVPIPFYFHGINIEATSVEIAFIRAGVEPNEASANVVPESAQFTIDGQVTSIDQHASEWAVRERDKRVNSFPSAAAEEGVHALTFESEQHFEPGRATLDGNDISHVRLRGEVRVRVVRPKIRSFFEVASRGRALTVDLELAGAELKVTFAKVTASG